MVRWHGMAGGRSLGEDAGRAPRGSAADGAFEELDVVRLVQDFVGPDGRIPKATAGIILQVFDRGEAYQVEFEAPHDVPETVPAELLMSDARPAQR